MQKTITNPVIKDQVTFTHTAQETEGRITSLSVTLMPGGATPMHFHRNFDETFQVTEGRLTVQVEDQVIELNAGQKLTVKLGQPHRFTNTTISSVSFETVIEPGSTGFENSLRILYGLAADGSTNRKGMPRNVLALAAISTLSDMHPAGAARILSPLFRLFSEIAARSGLTARLIRKYCR